MSQPKLTINILTIFPDFFASPLQESIIKRAQEAGLIKINIINIRDFTTDKHHVTDDRPFGGGPGMVMKIEPIAAALESLPVAARTRTLLTSAKGRLFTQAVAQEYAHLDQITIICGHYEGVDERVAEHLVDEEIRIGDYVLTGGEPAAAVMLDAVARLIPGVLGNEGSNQAESHSEVGWSGHPQYTRPEEFRGWAVPAELLTGHHAQINEWRQQQRRPLNGTAAASTMTALDGQDSK